MSANEKVTLQLSWLHQFQFAGYYVAKEKGFYKDVGLDVQINEFQFGMDLSTIIETNKADFAIGRSSLLIDKFNGKDIVALGAIYQSSPLMLLVTKKSGINKIEDFKNKKIMITPDAKSSASIIAMLNSKGISLNDVKIQKHSFNLNDLINGKTDAMASYISNEPIRLNEKNIDYKIFHPKDYGFNFYDDILFTSSLFIKNNPELTKNFFEATLKGWEYALNNIGEASEIIFYKYNSQKKTKIQLVKEAEALKKLVCNDKGSKIGCINKDVLKEIVHTYKVLGLMTADIDLDNFIYEHNPYKYYKFQFSNNDIIFILIVSALLILIIVTSIIYYSIKSKFLHTHQHLLKEIENSKEEIIKLTYIDELTQIGNRKSYNKKINELISQFNRYDSKFSIILFDIDNFKKINDTYGHNIGDKVLVELSKLISKHSRENDYFFRIGGEEFIVLLAETNLNNGILVAQNYKNLVEEELYSIINSPITISLGVTAIIKGDTETTLLERVDNLMYQSKNRGKNRVSSDELLL